MSAALPEGAVDLAAAPDPVAGWLAAHDAGRPVALRTSGTSGTPRSVVRTTDSWAASFAPVAALAGLTPRSRVWVPGPTSATMNLFAVVHAAVLGAGRVGRPEDATHWFLTPAALGGLLGGHAPLAGRVLVVAGDRCPAALRDRAAAEGARVQHYYGAAELSFVAWGSSAEDLRPFPGVDVAVRGGEIWVRSPYVCTGYDGPPGPLRREPGGFATVGDRGRLADGVLTVAGRPDAVQVAGSTVEPGAVEDVLRPHASGEVAVVGVPHDRLGSVLGVVLADAADHAPLRRVARQRLDGAERPRLWFHLERWPTTPAGKLDRAALTALLTADRGGPRRLV